MESSTTALVLISQLYSEGLLNDEDRNKLKGNSHPYCSSYQYFIKDMIFEEDAILLSLFENYADDEEVLRKAVLKYCKGTQVEAAESKTKENLSVNTQV